MKHKDGIDIIFPRNRSAWRAWLGKYHEKKKSIWVGYRKLAGGKKNITYSEAVEEALCFGWIDSKANRLDEKRTVQYFTRRSPKSHWSLLNKQRVSRLIKEERMQQAGLDAIRIARKNGTWNTLNDVDKLKVPEDLLQALKKRKRAHAYFEAFPKSAKRAILIWIGSAKTAETREKRIRETVLLAAKNQRANSYPRVKL